MCLRSKVTIICRREKFNFYDHMQGAKDQQMYLMQAMASAFSIT